MPSLPASQAAPRAVLNACLVAIAALALAVPALVVTLGPRVVPRHHASLPPAHIVSKAELPPVEPVAFADLTPDDARSYNDSIPFFDGPNPAARPFHFRGTDEERARARDCLATAMLYEAGDDTTGEKAVGQVVLNRARHPAFPKTICGVVFQGSDRSTGCQFTFTCDGALTNRRWSDAAWARARQVADAALDGAVDKPVGYATHYHTDWVVPYWQASLDKIAAVHTHLFFRWTGWWGTPPAFNRAVSSDEPAIAALAAYSDAHKTSAALAAVQAATAQVEAANATLPGATQTDPNSFVMALDRHMSPDGYAALATRICGPRDYCKLMGWTDRTKLPVALPLAPAQVATMSFSYLRDKAHNFDKPLWNCAEFKQRQPAQCMKLQVLAPVARPGLPSASDSANANRAQGVTTPPRTETYTLNVLPGSRGATPPPVVPIPRKVDTATPPQTAPAGR